MHYLIFFGIFGLPVVACAAMLITRLLDNAAAEKLVEPGPAATGRVQKSEFRMSDLADTFIPAPIEHDPKR